MARPRRDPTDAERAEIVRLARVLRRGLPTIVRRTRLPATLVRRVMVAEGLCRPTAVSQAWSRECRAELRPDKHKGPYTHDDHLRHTAGERAPERLARELGRSVIAVRSRLSALGISIGARRLELTVTDVAELLGRDPGTILAAIRRYKASTRGDETDDRGLRAEQVGGRWLVQPRHLRAWIVEDTTRFRWAQSSDPQAVLGLLVGLWGSTTQAERR